jgi:hypothetical protein
MSMQLTLAKIDAALLDVIRAEPRLLDRILGGDIPGGDDRPLPGGAVLTAEDRFSVDYRTLDAIAGTLADRTWFDRATGGADTVDYAMNYGPAFVVSPDHVREVAAGLAAEGWQAGPSSGEVVGDVGVGVDVDRSARALGEAAEWDPDEIEAYGPMMAATGTADFNVRVVRAIGTLAGWDSDTVDRVANAVASAEPEELDLTNDDYDLAGFFATAAREGKAVVGGID